METTLTAPDRPADPTSRGNSGGAIHNPQACGTYISGLARGGGWFLQGGIQALSSSDQPPPSFAPKVPPPGGQVLSSLGVPRKVQPAESAVNGRCDPWNPPRNFTGHRTDGEAAATSGVIPSHFPPFSANLCRGRPRNQQYHVAESRRCKTISYPVWRWLLPDESEDVLISSSRWFAVSKRCVLRDKEVQDPLPRFGDEQSQKPPFILAVFVSLYEVILDGHIETLGRRAGA